MKRITSEGEGPLFPPPRVREIPFDPLDKRAAQGAAAEGFVLDPNVPLPGQFSFRRVVRLAQLKVEAHGELRPITFRPIPAEDIAAEIELAQPAAGGAFVFNMPKAIDFWKRQALAVGLPASAVSDSVDAVLDLIAQPSAPRPRFDRDDVLRALQQYLQSLSTGTIELPSRTAAGRAISRVVKPSLPQDGAFYAIEEYQVSAFATRYGFGKTIKTFSLLPGEETTIRMRSWKSSTRSSSTSSSKTINDSSSIIDSVDQSAVDRFTNAVQSATSDKKTRSSEEQWHVEGEVGGGVGFVHANVKAGGGGDYRSGQEDFATRATEAVREHALEASRRRQNVVEMTSATSQESTSSATDVNEEENVVERTLRNVNLRRVLNFVFRELNQLYEVQVHLTNIRFAYSSGRAGSWREVAPSRVKQLVEEVAAVEPENGPTSGEFPTAAAIAKALLAQITPVVNHGGELVDVLECVLEGPNGSVGVVPSGRGTEIREPLDASLQTDPVVGLPPPPLRVRVHHRFKKGPLGQTSVPVDDGSPRVPGVVVGLTPVTMRTDSIVVEALLGYSDALDPFAFTSQEKTTEAAEAANELARLEAKRIDLALRTLDAISDPEKRAEAFAKMFPPPIVKTPPAQ